MALTDNDKQWIKGAIVEGINGALETVVRHGLTHLRRMSPD